MIPVLFLAPTPFLYVRARVCKKLPNSAQGKILSSNLAPGDLSKNFNNVVQNWFASGENMRMVYSRFLAKISQEDNIIKRNLTERRKEGSWFSPRVRNCAIYILTWSLLKWTQGPCAYIGLHLVHTSSSPFCEELLVWDAFYDAFSDFSFYFFSLCSVIDLYSFCTLTWLLAINGTHRWTMDGRTKQVPFQ